MKDVKDVCKAVHLKKLSLGSWKLNCHMHS